MEEYFEWVNEDNNTAMKELLEQTMIQISDIAIFNNNWWWNRDDNYSAKRIQNY
jgi:hypothetical protein